MEKTSGIGLKSKVYVLYEGVFGLKRRKCQKIVVVNKAFLEHKKEKKRKET